METYLNNKFGWSLGNKKGLYVWPYSSCTGHTTDKGNYVPTDLEESYKICKTYCEKKEKLGKTDYADYYKEMNDNVGEYETCSAQCDKIYEFLKEDVKENFVYVNSNENSTNYNPILNIVLLTVLSIIVLFFLMISFHF